MNETAPLAASEFPEFFRELWGYDPFPWQRRLARRVCESDWPACIALPTASGKTACIDIAVFALACQANRPASGRRAPRRVFFVVDRRVIVDEAFERAKELAKKLQDAKDRLLKRVADQLRMLAGDAECDPLECYELRGGVYRDNAWVRNPLQPTAICSTVDQVGSRVLFRGYGVTSSSAPIHAAMVASDSLIILDEAHCSEPFRQTLESVKRYRDKQWAQEYITTPLVFVELSATPRSTRTPFSLDDDDRRNDTLKARLEANKPARLVPGAHATATDKFAGELVNAAKALEGAGARRIAIIVNRVVTARRVHEMLVPAGKPAVDSESTPVQVSPDAELMIGRMRPIDRDELLKKWAPYLRASKDRKELERPVFVVATQCLEVGANLDFDAMVSECAGLDTLRQRFGRLLRLGRPENDKRDRVAVVVAPSDGVKKGADDPIYGLALAKTWDWLNKHAESAEPSPESHTAKRSKRKASSADPWKVIDMGIDGLDGKLPTNGDECRSLMGELCAPTPDAPVMLPAHVDCWVQTAPKPRPDPDVSLFLHGPQRGEPSVSVCWRADLDPAKENSWSDAVSLCPPSSPECMPVPIGAFRRWLRDQKVPAVDGGDTEYVKTDDEADRGNGLSQPRRVLRWRGSDEAEVIGDADRVRPGDVFVVPFESGGWNELGHVPADRPIDLGDRANLTARRRAVLRLCEPLVERWPDVAARADLLSWIRGFDRDTADDDTWDALRNYLRALADQLDESPSKWNWLKTLVDKTGKETRLDRIASPHPSGGVVLRIPRRLDKKDLESLGDPGSIAHEIDEDEGDARSFGRSEPVTLVDHATHVREQVTRLTQALGLQEDLHLVFERASILHDLGKLDPRWQAYIRNQPRWVPTNENPPWAKSGGVFPSPAERAKRRKRALLPNGFRHEFLSVQLAEHVDCLLDGFGEQQRELLLLLIGSHHGRSRPFASVVRDDKPPGIDAADVQGLDEALESRTIHWPEVDRRAAVPAHRLDSGVAERFWKLVRRYGWWGLAYLEAILRLADWQASEAECKKDNNR